MTTASRATQLLKRAKHERQSVIDRVKCLVNVLGKSNLQCAKEMHICQNYVAAIRKVYEITLPDGSWHCYHPIAEPDSTVPVAVASPLAYLDEPEGRLAAQLDQLMDREKPLLCPEFAKWLVRCVVLVAAFLPMQASAHDWYSELRSPLGGSCCDGHDCREVAECVTADKHAGVVLKPGVCVPIDYSKVLPNPSPDGKTHACTGIRLIPPGEYARCIVMGAST